MRALRQSNVRVFKDTNGSIVAKKREEAVQDKLNTRSDKDMIIHGFIKLGKVLVR